MPELAFHVSDICCDNLHTYIYIYIYIYTYIYIYNYICMIVDPHLRSQLFLSSDPYMLHVLVYRNLHDWTIYGW